MADRIQIRRDTAANWASSNPILADGELGIEKVTNKLKIGDGSTAWNSLIYFSSSSELPIGFVFTAVVSTNPNTLLGYGTWVSLGVGQTLVGVDVGDPDFDTVKKTGGTKTHTHSVTSNVSVDNHAAHTHSVTSNVTVGNHSDHTHSVTSNVTVDDHTLHDVESYVVTPQLVVAGGDEIHNVTNNAVTSGGASAVLSHSVTNNAVTSGAPSAALSHSVTNNAVTSGAGNSVQPYITVYFWERTA